MVYWELPSPPTLNLDNGLSVPSPILPFFNMVSAFSRVNTVPFPIENNRSLSDQPEGATGV